MPRSGARSDGRAFLCTDRLANIEVTIIEQTELAKREFIDE